MNSFVRAITQVCVITKDIETTARGFNQLGIGPFKCWYYRPPVLFNTRVRGREQQYTMKLGFAWVGAMEVEIIQPVDGESIYREFVTKAGDGLHHMMLGAESYEGALELLKQRQLSQLQSGVVNPPLLVGGMTLPPLPGMIGQRYAPRFTFIDSQDKLGTIIEFSRMPPGMPYRLGVGLGKADFWVPADARSMTVPLSDRFISDIYKVGIVTRDIESLKKHYAQYLDVDQWQTYTPNLTSLKLRGQDVNCRVQVAAAMIGDTRLELVQPLEGTSLYQEWLDTHGEGIHCIGVAADGLSYQQTIDRFTAAGCGVLMEGSMGDSYRFTYIDSKPLTGATMEIISIPIKEAAARLGQIAID